MSNRQRLLPHSLEAEASVLGGVLIRNEVLGQLDTLEAEDFYDHRHKVVFQAMRNLERARRPLDVVTVEAEIEKVGKLEAIGGVAFLGELVLRVPTVDNVLAYAEIVADKSRIRRLALVAGDLMQRAYETDLEVDEYFGEALRRIGELDRAKPDDAKPIGDVVKRRVREIEDLARAKQAGKPVHSGVPTGIAKLDAMLGGYPLGDLVVLAARPAMGKTAMALAAIDAATAAGFGVHVFASEGGWRMFADRCISRASSIPAQRLRAGDLSGSSDYDGIALAMVKYHHRSDRWLLDSRASLTALEIIRCVRRHKERLGTKLVVIDYITMLKRPRGLEHDENAALDATITALAQAAVDDDIAYLVLAQLNRKVEERNDKRPVMSDLRGSGALEERPRVIVSPYRGSYYSAEPRVGVDYECTCGASSVRGQACRCVPDRAAFERMAQVLILKNSNGATGAVDAEWNPSTTEIS